MRWLLLSDIHAHARNLERVLAHADGDWDRVVVLGDLIGYGDDPVAVVDRVRALEPAVCLQGNHEAMLLELVDGLRPAATAPIVHTLGDHARALGRERVAWLRELPHHALEEGFSAHHATPSGDYAYILSVPDARRYQDAMPRPLAFVGHSHVPGAFVRTQGRWRPQMAVRPTTTVPLAEAERALVNPGAVMAARDPRGGISYAVYDDEDAEVTLQRLDG